MPLRFVRAGESPDELSWQQEVATTLRRNALDQLLQRPTPEEGMMIIPIRLYRTAEGRICEESDPQAAFLLIAAGQIMADAEAQRLGVTAYLAKRQAAAEEKAFKERAAKTAAVEEKAVEKAEVEDKAVSEEETENKGIIFPPENRRAGGAPRR